MSYPNGIGDWKGLNPITPTSTSETRPAVKTAETKTAGRTETDETKLSPASAQIAQALGESDVRTEKVAALQKAIASGSYSVSSSDVADKLMQTMLG
ncbi:MAG TPA: flagellar biosynthesis anti-sigma factor FlgM [Edaphobacter sp.]|nr:flagellar biosynthesis anti-sigma factor FlgM [Edaphobacter sp.]